jgi:hypothetical protein
MATISQSLQDAKDRLNSGVNTVLPSWGIPSSSGGSASSLTAYTTIVFYPQGAPKKNKVVGGNSTTGSTWILPLPTDLSEPNSLQYESIEFGALAVAAAKVLENNPKGDEFDVASAVLELMTSKEGMNVIGEEILGAVGLETAINFVRASRRNTTNPNLENMFKTSNIRTFQFGWNITPLTEKDSNSLKSFIKEFKKAIYPTSTDVGGAWNRFLFPSEFVVSFTATDVNGSTKNIFKTAACCCTDFTVQYTPNGAFNTHVDGSPTTVSLNATFQEMYALDSNDIEGLS